ncbi:MAG: hypothetical protein AAFR60_08395, partial [Pseudomonadota bacterium]
MSDHAKSSATLANAEMTPQEALQVVIADPATQLSIDPTGQLVLTAADGTVYKVPNSDLLLSDLGITPDELLPLLEANRALLGNIVRISSAVGDSAADLDELRSQIELMDLTPGATDSSDD